jgi:hypothetical protein
MFFPILPKTSEIELPPSILLITSATEEDWLDIRLQNIAESLQMIPIKYFTKNISRMNQILARWIRTEYNPVDSLQIPPI